MQVLRPFKGTFFVAVSFATVVPFSSRGEWEPYGIIEGHDRFLLNVCVLRSALPSIADCHQIFDHFLRTQPRPRFQPQFVAVVVVFLPAFLAITLDGGFPAALFPFPSLTGKARIVSLNHFRFHQLAFRASTSKCAAALGVRRRTKNIMYTLTDRWQKHTIHQQRTTAVGRVLASRCVFISWKQSQLTGPSRP